MKEFRFYGPKMTQKDAIAYAKYVHAGKSIYSARTYKHGLQYGMFVYPFWFHNQVSRKSDNRLYKEFTAIHCYLQCCHLHIRPFRIQHPHKGFRWWRQRMLASIDWYWGWVDERPLF